MGEWDGASGGAARAGRASGGAARRSRGAPLRGADSKEVTETKET